MNGRMNPFGGGGSWPMGVPFERESATTLPSNGNPTKMASVPRRPPQGGTR